MSSVVERITRSPEETEALAAELAGACEGGELLVLTGELGAGKTCFVRGFVRGLGGDPAAVRSPSFTLLHSYAARRTVHHFDVYFTAHFEDLARADLAESLAAGDVALLEWGERFATRLAADHLAVELIHVDPETRRIVLRPGGARAERLLARALKAHDSGAAAAE